MSAQEKRKLEQEYQYLLILLDFYVKHKVNIQSKTETEYQAHIDDILDEMNRIKKILEKEDGKKNHD